MLNAMKVVPVIYEDYQIKGNEVGREREKCRKT
jgi:hypothetical protein